ncbi:MAG: ribosomal protein S18-alanine N-acetyltransferase [Magnetococcales bacterium]|nr:ribosomal protein S18-alanine N-acetyltransferase [Magnetococcales bacterium]
MRLVPLHESLLTGVVRVEAVCNPRPWTREQFAEELHPGGFGLALLDETQTPQGFLTARRFVGEWHLLNLGVAPAHRRQGWARLLTRQWLDHARESGAESVLLEVRRSNRAAQSLYESLGFREIGRRKDYYPGDPPEEGVVMRCRLSPPPSEPRGGVPNPLTESTPPTALLLVAPGCPHCAGVLEGLMTLTKEGALRRLEVINAAADPAAAEALGVLSVPWLRLGERFILEGDLPLSKLRFWLEQLALPDPVKATAVYFDHLFAAGRRQRVEAQIRQTPELLSAFATLLGDEGVEINTRLGIGAVLEELHGSGLAWGLAPDLLPLLRHPNPRLRGDACHYLSLTESPLALEPLRALLRDSHPDIREMAAEGLETLEESLQRRGTPRGLEKHHEF